MSCDHEFTEVEKALDGKKVTYLICFKCGDYKCPYCNKIFTPKIATPKSCSGCKRYFISYSSRSSKIYDCSKCQREHRVDSEIGNDHETYRVGDYR